MRMVVAANTRKTTWLRKAYGGGAHFSAATDIAVRVLKAVHTEIVYVRFRLSFDIGDGGITIARYRTGLTVCVRFTVTWRYLQTTTTLS